MSTGDPVVVEKRMPSSEDFSRLEGKVDELSKAISKLILIDERQTNQTVQIGKVENALDVFKAQIGKDFEVAKEKHDRLEKLVSNWVNRGIGAWAVAVVVFAIVRFGAQIFGH